jgi:hypothetical protein
MKQLLACLGPEIPGWSLLGWLIAANALLDGARPYERLRAEPQRVLEAARSFFIED